MIRLSRFSLHAVILFVVLWCLQVATLIVRVPVLEFVLALLFYSGFVVAALVVSSSLHRLDAVTFLVLVVTLLVSFPVASFADAVLVVTPFLLGVPLGLGLRRVVGDFVDRRRDESPQSLRAGLRGPDRGPSGVVLGGRPAFQHNGDRLLGPGGDDRAHGDRGADGQGRPAIGRERGALRDVPRADCEPTVLPTMRVRPVRPGHPPPAH